jgi:hypothetical protein
MRSNPAFALLAAAALLSGAPLAASASVITFNGLSPQTLLAPASIGAGELTLSVSGGSAAAAAVIDTGTGALATAACFTTLCADNATQAVYAFQGATLSLTAQGGYAFDATGFDAALASIFPSVFPLNTAVRLQVSGSLYGAAVASATYLLLPPEYAGTQPADTASTDATQFASLALSGFTKIDTLTFALTGALAGDTSALTVDTGFSTEFALDNVVVSDVALVPEPASAALLLSALLGLRTLRRRR